MTGEFSSCCLGSRCERSVAKPHARETRCARFGRAGDTPVSSKVDCAVGDAATTPDVVVSPRLAHLHLLDFHRAREAIDEGKRAANAIMHNLRALGDHPS